MIAPSQIGRLTQGTFFSCAVADEYDGLDVYGLIITARCDVTNDKAEVFNYVPIVSFDDWLQRDGSKMLADRVEKTAMGDLRNILKQANLAPSILDTMSPRAVLNAIFLAADAEKGVVSKRVAFEKATARHERALSFLAGGCQALDLLHEENKEAGRIIKELCQNAIAEAYYLPSVDADNASDSFVALLREVRHIPRLLAASIATGLDHSSYRDLCSAHPRLAGKLCVGEEAISWPTANLTSPYIEHLMQRLMMLFSRIGVSDIDEAQVLALQNRIPSRPETHL